MSAQDKLKNTVQQATGGTKEQVGEATDDQQLQAEGGAEKTGGDLKQAGEKLKDALK